MACFCVLMAQNRYIFLPPNSLDSPKHDASILNTAESTSNFVLQECGSYLEVV